MVRRPARQVCRRSRKSDAPAGRTPDRIANRRTILRALVAGEAALDVRLETGGGRQPMSIS
jgi:hypothetical protein